MPKFHTIFHLKLLATVAIVAIVAFFSSYTLNAEVKDIPGVKPKPSLVIDLYSGDAPGFVSGGKPEKVINDRIRNVSKPQMLVWFPKERSAKGTTMIICPGGGYGHLAMNLHAGNVVSYLNNKGITVIGLKYRTRYGKNNVVADALADGKRAVRIARAHAKEWKLDPSRIGIQGYSAGANLCLNLSANHDLGDATSADPIERVSSRPDFIALMCPWPNGKTLKDFPLEKTAPPTFIAHARDDNTAAFSFGEAINDKLKSLGVQHKLFSVETGGHAAFHYGVSKPPGVNWPNSLLGWLQQIKMLDTAALETELPKVLIMGDSISLGYTPFVKKLLVGKAEVIHHKGNAGPTIRGIKQIDSWLGDTKWDLIHFNFGLWDMYGWEYVKQDRSPAMYEKRLETLVQRLEKTGAKLIWATTTPACPAPEFTMHKRFKSDVTIAPALEKQYLDAAQRVMKKHKIPINDLHALIKPTLQEHAVAQDNVHFRPEGRKKLAQQVAEKIIEHLEP